MRDKDSIMLPSFIICGYERGGTTLLSELIRQQGYYSLFEIGVLMNKTPKDFLNYQPYLNNLSKSLSNPTNTFLKDICSGSFEEFYEKIFRYAKNKKLYNHGENVKGYFDKTPIYMSNLRNCLNRTDFIKKAVIISRDPRSVFISYAKRINANDHLSLEEKVLNNFSNYCQRYFKYYMGCRDYLDQDNVHHISFEKLCLHTNYEIKKLGQFIDGKNWSFNNDMKPMFNNVTNSSIDVKKVDEYEKYLGKKTQNMILSQLSQASKFFANLSDQSIYSVHARRKYLKLDIIGNSNETKSKKHSLYDFYKRALFIKIKNLLKRMGRFKSR